MKRSDAILIILFHIHGVYPHKQAETTLDEFSKKEIEEAGKLLSELEKFGLTPYKEMDCECCTDIDWEDE